MIFPARSVIPAAVVAWALIGLELPACAAVPVPLDVADNIQSIETTELDIGAPDLLFDNNPHTLIRTPSINPAYVELAFSEPVTFRILRVQLLALSEFTVAAADNLEELRSKSGSYRVIVPTRENAEKGWGQVEFPDPVTAGAIRLDTLRTEGDDYVHISELQFCNPGEIDAVDLVRVTDRRKADIEEGQAPVDGPVETWVNTMVWFKARGSAGGVPIDLEQGLEWEALDDGIEPFGAEPGMFVVTTEGEHGLRLHVGEFERTVTLTAQPRTLSNRGPDIEVAFIERLPRIDYPDADNTDPRAGWPAEGSEVTWRGHLYNWGIEPVDARYVWTLDGRVVGHGEVTLPPGPPSTEFTTVDLPWTWGFERHDLALTIRPTEPIEEMIAPNNSVTVQTDAITVGFYVEQSVWDMHHEHQYKVPTRDANSFAGWSQRMMRKWNEMFREAVYPNEYPDGIVERVRLDRLVIVPDFALPLNGGIPSNNPDLEDRTIDMQWGHEVLGLHSPYEVPEDDWFSPERAIKAFAAGRVDRQQEDPPLWCGLGYIHEMAHARYLVDAYGFNVHTGHGDDITERMIPVEIDGEPLLGTHMRLEDDIQHWRKHKGQMGGDYWRWSAFDAMCWNRRAGWRARGGNCNAPPTIGEFLQDIPTRCVYRYVDTDGSPLADAEVRVYRARGTGMNWYTKKYPTEPDLVIRTDTEGRVVLDRTVWAEDGEIRHTYGHSNGVVLVVLVYDGREYCLFEEVTDANLAWNLGHHDEYTFTREIRLRDGAPSPEDWDVDNKWQPEGVGFGRR